MSKRDEIAKVVNKNSFSLCGTSVNYTRFYDYHNFPENKRSNLLKIDQDAFFDDMAAFVTFPSGFFSNKDDYGILFMISGVYLPVSLFGKKYYFLRYSDIKNISAKTGTLVEEMEFTLKDGFSFSFSVGSDLINSYGLEKILNQIIKIDKNNPTESSKSGYVAGISGESNRKAFLKGQISGYKRASSQYELKLTKQAELFEKQILDFKKEKDAYKKLISDMLGYIKDLESKKDLTSADRNSLDNVRDAYNRIKNLG